MIGFSKELRTGMLQVLLNEMNGPNIKIILLSREWQDGEYGIADIQWKQWDGTPGSTQLSTVMAMDTTGDVPFLYNVSDLEFEEGGGYPDIGYIAIIKDTGTASKFLMIHPLVSSYDWQGDPFMVPAGDFRIYI